MNKTKIKETLFSIQNQIITDLKERISSNKELVSADPNDTHDPEDYSHQSESTEMDQILEQQLAKANHDFEKLQTIDFEHKESIELGTIVQTDKFTFVISVATIPFIVDDTQYIGISTEAPIYAVLKDKKIGDSFQFGNNHYSLISIN